MKKIFVISMVLILMFSLSACSEQQLADIKPTVAVSIVTQAAIVKAIAGDFVEVVTMIPPGYSPGNYEPSPKGLSKFSEASIYFSIGVAADQANILPKARDINPEIRIVRVNEEIAKVYREREFAPGKRDPHIWLSPKRMQLMVDIIARELTELDPEHKQIYKSNAENYKEKLADLDKEIRKALKGIKNKTFIVYHPAFGYFADDYGLKMLAIEKDGKKATPQRIQKIIDIAKKQNIKTVFYQKEIDSRQSEALAREIGGKTIQLDPLAEDYISNLKKIAQIFKSSL